MKTHPVTLLAALILFPGAGSSFAAPDFQADSALRAILNIRSFCGSVKLPQGRNYFKISVCHYKDGKLIKEVSLMGGDQETVKVCGDGRQIQAQLLWGLVGDKMKVNVSTKNASNSYVDPFWNHLDGGSANVSETSDTTPEGWSALGYACSQTPRSPAGVDGVRQPGLVFGNVRAQLESSKYVGVLVVRTFPGEEEWKRAMQENFKPSREDGDTAAGNGSHLTGG